MPNDTLNQDISFDDLLDGTLDDIADMPEFKPFAAGAHKLSLQWDYTKKINDMPAIELKLTCIESVELTNPEDVPPKAGDTTNVIFILKKKDEQGKVVRNELAEGQWKKILAELAPAFPEANGNPRALMDGSKGFEVLGVTSIRENKKDKNNIKQYTSLDAITLL